MGSRFAPIIRVSTEKQEKKGESLTTQRTQINNYVKTLKGTIPERCWQYTGHEHATPNQERAKLDKLLTDSGKNLFDAVIVCDASRWSRDNLKSKTGLEILRKNGIRFFVGGMEYDLFNPEHKLYLGLSAELGEFQARQQAQKSIVNRIERAKRGIPTCGKLPYGRIYDKATNTWGLDVEKAKKIQQAAARYLKGESIEKIGASIGMNVSFMWKMLNHLSGTTWPIRFRAKDLNIDETIEIKIPPLLDNRTIAAIRAKGNANRTFTRGAGKNKYLLSHFIACGECGYAMSGQINAKGKRYYRHVVSGRRERKCTQYRAVPADMIENSVLIHLVRTLGDDEAIREAIRRATPNIQQQEKLIEEQSSLRRELEKVGQGIERLVQKVVDGTLADADVKKQREKLRTRENQIRTRLSTIEAELDATSASDPARLKRWAKYAVATLADATKNNPKLIFKRPFEWKRRFVERVFSGTDSEGRRLGVYVTHTADPAQPWAFEIRGGLEPCVLGLPLSDEYLEEAFHLDPEYQDVTKKMKKIRSAIDSNFTLSLPSTAPLEFHFPSKPHVLAASGLQNPCGMGHRAQ